MKINKLNIYNYGKFTDESAPIHFKDGVNVILGENEAGKSTIRHALGEMLFGFQTKRMDKHPYSQGLALQLHGEVETAHGDLVGVQRSLKNLPQGQKIIGDHVTEIGNSVLENFKEIPYLLYKGLFEMDLSELVALDGQKWNAVEEQISLQYGLDNIFTPQFVLSQIEEEMHQIWRPHNRGKFTVKDIDETLLNLKEKKRDLSKQRKGLEERLGRKESLDKELNELNKVLEVKKQWLQNAEGQMDVFKKLNEVRKIEMELNAFDFKSMRVETYNYLKLENEKLREEKQEVEKELQSIQSQKYKFTPIEERLLASKDQRDKIVELIESFYESQRAYELQKTAVSQSKSTIENKSLELTMDPWNDALMQYWIQLDLKGLEKSVNKRLRYSFGNISLWIIVLAGLGLVGGGFYTDKMQLIYSGGGLAILSCLLMFGSFNKSPLEFGDIQFRDQIWKKRDVFIDACESMSELSRSRSREFNDHEASKLSHRKLKGDLEDIIINLGFDTSNTLKENADEIMKCIHNINKKESSNKLLESNASIHNGRKRKVGHALLMNQQKLTTFKNELKNYGESTEEALAMLERLSTLSHRRDMLLEELELFDKTNPQQNAYRQSTHFDESVSDAKVEIDHLKLKRENLKVEQMAVQKDEERVFEDVRFETLESEISKLEWQRETAIDTYNKLRMIHTMIKFADETFRSKYQPELLKRASDLLKVFTNDKYDSIAAGEAGKLQVRLSEQERYIPVQDHLSRGTLEQIYLALRLAVAETIDQTQQFIPIILDEVFVNWDKNRLKGAINVLSQMSQDRQIIYFTCHEWMAEELANAGANKVIL